MSTFSRRSIGCLSGILCLGLLLFLHYWPELPSVPFLKRTTSDPLPPIAKLQVPGDNRSFLPWFEDKFFGFPPEGGDRGESATYRIAVSVQTLPDGVPNFLVREGEGETRLTIKEYDLRFLSSGNAETLHEALFAYLSDLDTLNSIMTEMLRFRVARKRTRSNAFAFKYLNREQTLVGNIVISIRDTEPGSAVLTLQLWESPIRAPDRK